MDKHRRSLLLHIYCICSSAIQIPVVFVIYAGFQILIILYTFSSTYKIVIILFIVYHYHPSTMSFTLSLAWNINTMSCMENFIVCRTILRLLIFINYRLLIINSFQGVYRWKTLSLESNYFEKKSFKWV